jgi:transposase
VVRYNAEGLVGLHDRPKPGRPQRLDEGEQAALAARVFTDPDPDKDGGVSAWTRADLCRWLEARFEKKLHPSSLSRVLRQLELSRQKKTRPVHPRVDPAAQERFQKKGCARR